MYVTCVAATQGKEVATRKRTGEMEEEVARPAKKASKKKKAVTATPSLARDQV